MNEEKHIHYDAADLARYHNGQMTAAERHALEKAALDDPFLADAVEGYANQLVNVDADIESLNKRLDERIGKVIPIKKSRYAWLRIAALLLLMIGGGLLTYNYFFVNSKQDVALVEKKDTVANKDTVTNTQPASNSKNDSAAKTKDTNRAEETASQQTLKPNEAANKNGTNSLAKQKASVRKEPADDTNKINLDKVQGLSVVSEQSPGNKEKGDTVTSRFNANATAANANEKSRRNQSFTKDKDPQPSYNAKAVQEMAVDKKSSQQTQTHLFRGQVKDLNNNPLPFANVTIVPDNIGTYTDAKGNFTLVSPDSTLHVRIRSVGFENKMTNLQTALSNNYVVLDQDTQSIPSTMISNRKINSERKKMNNNMQLEEPEPADGWYNYDTYIANNIHLSDEIKTKTNPSSEVELSFEVNELGEPVNIHVEKSVCKECDAEAIRLLKEGPKWKKNKMNRRARVAVNFML